MKRITLSALVLSLLPVFAQAITVSYVKEELTKNIDEKVFANAKEEVISLTAQPMVVPRPSETKTHEMRVRAVHNGDWVAFQMKWNAKEQSAGGKLGTFSDAVAIQFPVLDNKVPPPVFMGLQGNPVHIYHWRAQFQVDKEKGLQTTKDLYPNMSIDTYPMEFKDQGSLKDLSMEKREAYSSGISAGNPQSHLKSKGFDEIMAEGFGSSAVIENTEGFANGIWKEKEWTVVISRPLKREKGSVLVAGETSFAAFAVWQGSEGEVGSRKSVTMNWIPLELDASVKDAKVAVNNAN